MVNLSHEGKDFYRMMISSAKIHGVLPSPGRPEGMVLGPVKTSTMF
jgi:hypothetical protein